MTLSSTQSPVAGPEVFRRQFLLTLACWFGLEHFGSQSIFGQAPTRETVPEYAWERVTAKAPFAPRDGAGALTFKGRMWLIGGWNPGDKKNFPRTCNNEVWSSADGKDWRLDKANSFLDHAFDTTRDWEGRHTAGYVVHKDRMWIVGGDVNQGHYQFDVWSLDRRQGLDSRQ